MIKKVTILLLLMTVVFGNPISANEAKAQERAERTIERKKKRKIRKRTRRRTRRRVRRRVTRRAHYAYRALPRYRATVAVLPTGAVRITRGGVVYHYHRGIYYRPLASGFTIIRPVTGIYVTDIPPNREEIIVSNRTFFYYYGTFYQAENNQYRVVDAPEGAQVRALPEGYEVERKNDIEYYVLDGVYFQELEDENGDLFYEVISV